MNGLFVCLIWRVNIEFLLVLLLFVTETQNMAIRPGMWWQLWPGLRVPLNRKTLLLSEVRMPGSQTCACVCVYIYVFVCKNALQVFIIFYDASEGNSATRATS